MVSHIHIHSSPHTLSHSHTYNATHTRSPTHPLTLTYSPRIASHTHTYLHTLSSTHIPHTLTHTCTPLTPTHPAASCMAPSFRLPPTLSILPYIYTPQVLQHPATSSCCKPPQAPALAQKASSAPPSCGTMASEVLENHTTAAQISVSRPSAAV